MISPAPTLHNPSGLRPVAATGAGDQFATGLNMGASWDDGYTGLGSGLTQNGTDTQRTGRVGGIQRRWVWIGTVGPVKDGHANAGLGTEWHGQAWLHVTPRNGGNFSGLAIASQGWARQCSAGRGNNATRGDIAGQFPRFGRYWCGMSRQSTSTPGWVRRGKARRGRATRYPERNLGQFIKDRPGWEWPGWSMRALAGQCNNVTGDGNPGHFPKHQEAPASRGATVDGMTGSV